MYRQCEQAYAELAKGTVLLELSKSIQLGGRDNKGLPRLAIARADRREIRFDQGYSGRDNIGYFDSSKYALGWSAGNPRSRPNESLRVSVDMGVDQRDVKGFALVPMVPADVRPATGQLKDWHILWEVDVWSESPRTMPPPRDPILLRHVGGDLYAVLAQWDLTDLEMAILGGALQ